MNVGQFVHLMEKKKGAIGRLMDSDEYVLRILRLTPYDMTIQEHIHIFSDLPLYIEKFNQNMSRMVAWSWFTSEKKNKVIF
jgi:hypothetical protein